VNDEANTRRFKEYEALANKETNVIFGGRMAEYKYYDMHQVIGSAIVQCSKLFPNLPLY
jgi:UDP-galactopyranose mutase